MKHRNLLLKAAEIAAMPGELKTHFLNPNAVRLSKSLGDAVGLQHLGVHLVEVEPERDTTEFHIHLYEEECVYVLAGEGTLILEDGEQPLGKGDFVGFPARRTAHNIRNTGKGVLKLLVMGQRLQQDVADYPQQKKRLYRNSGEWNLVDLQHVDNPKK